MSSRTIILSSAGLRNIVRDNNEFTFSFGEQEIHMNNIFAEFISPIVSHLHHSDPTISQLYYKMPPNTNIPRFEEIFTEDIIIKIKAISNGTATDLSESDSQKMRLASILLCNEELFSKIDEIFPISDTTDETVKRLEELETIEIMKNMTSENILDAGSIFSALARNFYLFDKSKMKTISKPLFHSIISNDHLKIESEDWLFDMITEYFEGEEKDDGYDSDIMTFIDEVKIRHLSDSKFKELLHRVDAAKMTESLWRSIRNRICREEEEEEEEGIKQRYTKETAKPPGASARVFSFDGQERNRLKGIISFLAKEAGGNVHENGAISVTSSSELNNDRLAKNAVDLDNANTIFATKDFENSWLMYDFKDRKVRPTHYSIMSRPSNPCDWHPKSWVVEVSNSGNEEDWAVIDRRSGVTSLSAKSVICTFNVQQPRNENEFYRYVRLRQTGINANGSHNLSFSSLEFFGSII